MGNSAAKGEVLPVAKTEDSFLATAAGDALVLKTLEEKAALIDQKLAEYEKRVANAPDAGVGESSKVLSARYIAELKELRKVLVDAEKEQNSLLEKVTELETAKSKLEYQVKHLKKALQ